MGGLCSTVAGGGSDTVSDEAAPDLGTSTHQAEKESFAPELVDTRSFICIVRLLEKSVPIPLVIVGFAFSLLLNYNCSVRLRAAVSTFVACLPILSSAPHPRSKPHRPHPLRPSSAVTVLGVILDPRLPLRPGDKPGLAVRYRRNPLEKATAR